MAASRPTFRERLRQEIALARESGTANREELYECLLQIYLFAGFPAALEGIRALEKLWPSETIHTEPQVRAEVARYPDFVERGEQLYKRVYAKNAAAVEREMLRLSPELASWAVVEGYGKTLSREALDIQTRELCIVAILTQLGWDRQLFSHILGARNVGALDDDIHEAVAIGAMQDASKLARAEELLERSA